MRDSFVSGLLAIAKSDPRIMLLTGDLGFGVLNEFEKTCPTQLINVGVAEQNMTGIATGMALEGRIVFTYSIGNFPTLRCLEQIRNDAAYHDANVKIVSIGGGFSYGALGISHHATEDLAIMRALPAVTVLAPSCDWEAEQAAIAMVENQGTNFIRLDKSSPGKTNKDGEIFVLGKARTLFSGADLTIVTCGGILEEVMQARLSLLEIGIEVAIVSMHTVHPLDLETLEAAAGQSGGILTVEEHRLRGGLGSAVAEHFMDSGSFPKRFKRMGLKEEFSSVVGSQKYLRNYYGLDSMAIVETVKNMLSKNP